MITPSALRDDPRVRKLSDAEFRCYINLLLTAETGGGRIARSGYVLAIEVTEGNEELLSDTVGLLEVLGLLHAPVYPEGEEDEYEIIFSESLSVCAGGDA